MELKKKWEKEFAQSNLATILILYCIFLFFFYNPFITDWFMNSDAYTNMFFILNPARRKKSRNAHKNV